MERIIDRLDKYLKSNSISDNAATEILGLSVGTISKSRKEGRDFSARNAEKALNVFQDLDRVWLLTGEGDMLRTAEAREVGEGEGIAVYDVDFACGFSEFLDSAMHPVGYYSIPPYNDPNKYNIVRSTGDSMLPSIADRAWVVIGRQALSADDVIYGDIYAIETTSEIRTIKRIVRSDDKACVRLVPDNQSPVHGTYQDFAKSSIRACYKVYAALNITTF